MVLALVRRTKLPSVPKNVHEKIQLATSTGKRCRGDLRKKKYAGPKVAVPAGAVSLLCQRTLAGIVF